MRKLWYVPLESYKERYTVQLSAPKTGWLERNWINEGIDYSRINGLSQNTDGIKVGSVLDATGRGYYSCSQMMILLELLRTGEITSDDAIYFDDFWTPGMSALPYAFDQMGVHPKLYSMLHAQSIDIHDFTYSMRYWMRHFEIGIGKIMSGIFVTSTCLKDLCLYNNVGDELNVFLTGLPYNSFEVKTHWSDTPPLRLKNQVVFSSRWDKEKDPGFFMNLMETAIVSGLDVKFVITTSAKKLRSNEPRYLEILQELIEIYPDSIELRENQSKEEYYNTLRQSNVQINTADQDFVSWTLLEATTCGCRPLYPYFLSFPEVLKENHYMYAKRDVWSALKGLKIALQKPFEDHSHIYKPFDKSWKRMLSIMKGEEFEALY
jgi:hypothetical protein